MNAMVPVASNAEAYRASTDAAEMCREIVVATASNIQGKRYVGVEGWQAIAIAHGCAAGSRDVERVEGGVRALGEVRRMSDGVVIATAEGFVGEDEPTWYGGVSRGKTLPKRADYAIRAMAQTRAISRACRSAFAHVVVMMKAGLATTPAEEVPYGGFDDHAGETVDVTPTPVEPAARQKLEGPHTSKTALRKAVHDIIAEVRKAQSVEAIEALKTEHKRTINQAVRDWPDLINGDPNIPEDLGLKGVVEQRKAELDPDCMVNRAIRDMHETVRDLDALATWKDTNAAYLEQLDGADSRRFQAAYDEFEASLSKAEETAALVAAG